MRFKDAMTANARAVARLSDADLKALLPVLEEARRGTARGLDKWLRRVDGEDKYTAAVHRQLLTSIDSSIRDMKRELFPAIHRDLQAEARDAGLTALRALKKAADAGAKKFEDSAFSLKFDATKVVLSSTRSLMSRHEASARRYAGRQGDDIRKIMAVGLLRGESVDSVVSRLMRKPMMVSSKMSDSDTADAIAQTLFFRSRADAERLVRTENIHAANATQMDALTEDNERAEQSSSTNEPPEQREPQYDEDGELIESDEEDREDSDGDGEGGWLLRWDATFDKRTCEYCEDMDGEIRAPGEEFDEGVLHPPLHPYCRCAVTPWREGWEL